MNQGELKGRVVERGEFSGISGATVILQTWKTSRGGSYSYDSVHTDTNGDFTFNRQRKANCRYNIFIREANHFSESGPSYRWNNFYYLYAFAYLRIRVTKMLPGARTIAISVAGEHFAFNRQNPFDTIINKTMTVRAEYPYRIKWDITDEALPPGQQNPNELGSNILIKKNDTLTYRIRYD